MTTESTSADAASSARSTHLARLCYGVWVGASAYLALSIWPSADFWGVFPVALGAGLVGTFTTARC